MHTRQKLMQLLEKFYDPWESRHSSRGSDPASGHIRAVSEWVGRQSGVHLTRKASLFHKLHSHAQVPLHRRVWSTSIAKTQDFFPPDLMRGRLWEEKSGLMEVLLVLTSGV